MLGRLRSGHPTPADADKLIQYHLTNFGNAEVEAITSTGTTMHLFAKKAPRDEFNYQKLQKVSSSSNPVALVKTKWESTSGKAAVRKAHFPNPPAKMQQFLAEAPGRRNFEPEWGLFNNSVGEVEEIIFEEGRNPNTGDQPCYVAAVKFPQCSGPVWDPLKPKVRTRFLMNTEGCSFGSQAVSQVIGCLTAPV